ncbi:MAG: SDR family NAD(P)-dependent oxidoreductase [Isosphaeraceae bacterium]
MSGTLAGKVALVTGGGSGIGRATARAFAREGAKVVVADIDQAAAQAVADELSQTGGASLAVRTDVSDEAEVVAMVAAAVRVFGRIDCAFNNAGIGCPRKPTHEYDLAEYGRVIAVNLTGVFLCMKHELPVMLQQGGGSIVNNASVAGLRGTPTLMPYVASKHGVIGLTRASAKEYAAHRIRINAVCPGWTDTALTQGVRDDPQSAAMILARPARPIRDAGGDRLGGFVALVRRCRIRAG